MSSIRKYKNLPEKDISFFEETYRRYAKRVYAFSLKYLRNKEDAEGMVQEVFIKLWAVRHRLSEIENLEAWIFTVSFNIIRKHFKRIAREKNYIQSFSKSDLSDSGVSMTEIEYNDLIKQAEVIIDKLPDRQKAVYLLSKKEGLSNSEIALKLKITKKTVENHLFKAKVFIRNMLIDEGLI
jgi:RNA polymerase sigma-70 factor (ECF subfamily)